MRDMAEQAPHDFEREHEASRNMLDLQSMDDIELEP